MPEVEFHSRVLPRISGGKIAAMPEALRAGSDCRSVSKTRRLSGVGKVAAANAACNALSDVGTMVTDWAANWKLAKLGVSNASSSAATLAAVAAGSASCPGPVPPSPPHAAASNMIPIPPASAKCLCIGDINLPQVGVTLLRPELRQLDRVVVAHRAAPVVHRHRERQTDVR